MVFGFRVHEGLGLGASGFRAYLGLSAYPETPISLN